MGAEVCLERAADALACYDLEEALCALVDYTQSREGGSPEPFSGADLKALGMWRRWEEETSGT